MSITPHLNPPKQSRSRRTLERLVRASLQLLEQGGPDALTVQAVVALADSSVGSFYARFRGKDDLIDYLGARVWQDSLERWEDALASRDWAQLELHQLTEGCVGLLVDAQRSRASYLKALDRAAGGQDGVYERFRGHLVDGITALLLTRRSEFDHIEPERAVRLGLCAVIGIAEAPAGSQTAGLDRAAMVSEACDLLLGYLTATQARDSETDSGQVDFFDIWG